MNKTSIEWTHRPETGGEGFTWNPIRARNKETGKVGTFCTHASPGCLNCYAEAINKRFGNGLEFNVPNLEKIEFFMSQKILEAPLRKNLPCTIFGGDMNDMFHESIPDEFIDRAVTVVALAQWHTFQFLTKRAERMMRYFQALTWDRICECANQNWEGGQHGVGAYNLCSVAHLGSKKRIALGDWTSYQRLAKPPLPNLWLGVSCESQKYADERIPLLLQTPAVVRFLSVEPMLESVRLDECAPYVLNGDESNPGILNAFTAQCHHPLTVKVAPPKTASPDGISWVICGGESGPGARPFNLAWAESLQEQCKAAGVVFFMKQVGSRPVLGDIKFPNGDSGKLMLPTENRKGGDPAEWPEHLRVREFPAEKKVTA